MMAQAKRKEFHLPETYHGILKNYITSPRHLKMTLDVVFPITPYSTVNHIYRSFVWLLFSGMTAEMTVYVDRSDVDLSMMRIAVPCVDGVRYANPIYRAGVREQDEFVPIYAEAVPDFLAAIQMENFYEPPRGKAKARYCIREDGTLLLRSYQKRHNQTPAQRLLNSLKPVVEHALDKARRQAMAMNEVLPEWFPANTSCKKIELSGKYYRAYEFERMGLLEWVAPQNVEVYNAWRYDLRLLSPTMDQAT